MSVSTEIDRLQLAADGIRGKIMELGAAESGDDLTTLSQKITVLEKPNGNKGQVVGFVEDNEIGAMDAPTGSGGGGAIPAYIVGDTMTAGWLSETSGGDAFTPVDKQEYVILTEGEWLRKHVMWVADLGVYRLTGKVETADEVLDSYIIGETESDTTLTGLINPVAVPFRELTITRGMKQITVGGSGSPTTRTFIRVGDYTYLKKDGEIIITAPAYSSSDVWNVPMPTGTIELTDEDVGKKIEWCFQRGDSRTEVNYTINLHIVTNTIFDDYETDDVIDITEAEIVEAFDTAYGHPAPVNNVYSTEEAAWGVWIDGKTIYRKTVDCGSLNGQASKNVNHGISDMDKVVHMEAIWLTPTAYGTTPSVSSSGVQRSYFYVTPTTIVLQADSASSNFAASNVNYYVTLYYTKA